MQNKMNMKNKTHKCVPRNNQINISTQEPLQYAVMALEGSMQSWADFGEWKI